MDDDTFDFDEGMGGMPLGEEPPNPREMARQAALAQANFVYQLMASAVLIAGIRTAPYLVYVFEKLFKR